MLDPDKSGAISETLMLDEFDRSLRIKRLSSFKLRRLKFRKGFTSELPLPPARPMTRQHIELFIEGSRLWLLVQLPTNPQLETERAEASGELDAIVRILSGAYPLIYPEEWLSNLAWYARRARP